MDPLYANGKVFSFPYADLIRDLTPDEKKSLKESIAGGWYEQPAVVDENYAVIDGRNRLQMLVEGGFELQAGIHFVVRRGLPEEEKARLAVELNMSRRHLTISEIERTRRERVDREKQARTEGKSLRQIADTEGVTKTTVVRDLQQASVVPGGGTTVAPALNVTGKSGRSYPAKRPAKPVAEAPKLCQRCTQFGCMAKGCPECAKLNGKAAKPSKSGSVKFDDRKMKSALHAIVRMMDQRVKAHGNTPGAKDFATRLEHMLKSFDRWQLELK